MVIFKLLTGVNVMVKSSSSESVKKSFKSIGKLLQLSGPQSSSIN